jgi:hypothetical protein
VLSYRYATSSDSGYARYSMTKGAAQQGLSALEGDDPSHPHSDTDVSAATAPDGHSPAFPLVRAYVEPPAGIEPATPSLPWNHREPLCGPPFPQVAPNRRGQSYRFSLGEVMRSLSGGSSDHNRHPLQVVGEDPQPDLGLSSTYAAQPGAAWRPPEERTANPQGKADAIGRSLTRQLACRDADEQLWASFSEGDRERTRKAIGP